MISFFKMVLQPDFSHIFWILSWFDSSLPFWTKQALSNTLMFGVPCRPVYIQLRVGSPQMEVEWENSRHRCPFLIGWLINRGVCLPRNNNRFL